MGCPKFIFTIGAEKEKHAKEKKAY